MNVIEGVMDHPAEAPAIVDHRRRVTYGELRAEADVARAQLAAAGVAVGDRVGLALGNTADFAVWYLATLGIGAVAVPVNPLDAAGAMAAELESASVGAFIVPASADQLAAAAPSTCTVLAADGSHMAGPASGDVQDPPPLVSRSSDDVAVLVFTSGTAGTPKAAMLTHGNLDYNLRQAEAHGGILPEPSDVLLGIPPLFHVLGLHAVLGSALRMGASVVLMERFDPAPVAAMVEREAITMLLGVPAMWRAFLITEVPANSFATVRVAATGAARLDPAVARSVEERFGVVLSEGYGLTEAAALVATSAGVDAPPGSIGVPVPGMELRIVDETGEDVLVGDPGEILLRGGNVFAGYWNDPEATARVLDDDGWLSTGDIAVVDDDGFLYLVDRAKDLIIVSGFNVSPAEVESILLDHPAVVDAAVVGADDERTGEKVRAHVVLISEVDTAELRAHCKERLARYKCPAEIVVEPSLPRGATGKVLRRILR